MNVWWPWNCQWAALRGHLIAILNSPFIRVLVHKAHIGRGYRSVLGARGGILFTTWQMRSSRTREDRRRPGRGTVVCWLLSLSSPLAPSIQCPRQTYSWEPLYPAQAQWVCLVHSGISISSEQRQCFKELGLPPTGPQPHLRRAPFIPTGGNWCPFSRGFPFSALLFVFHTFSAPLSTWILVW